ncbi:C40 family peptidase [[Clostridium] polysaccharolyticum]|uniref:Cell wall-associated hydrolase, NlpC family n=1 Tax=[Clostridium] polysaccharolyticum TaxID=29364 RepID=A0A1I0FWV5_9FIRM|nr:SH3 domain-containing C40 family peptidase [[Clostridium] polysaccharolyticum]SET62985.1 Cell wall-associated hydrolase, NlpC family [[Clostridium] polysaccharolyticum]
MKSNRLKVALFSTGLAMSISVFALPEAVSASALSTDKALAGISLVLDEFCGEENVKEVKVKNVASAGTVENGTATEETQKVKETAKTVKKAEKKESKYADMGISIANNYVNIRRKPNTESRILGKLYKGSAATIIKRQGDWVKIKSGSVTGWINSDFLAIGFDAEELEGKYGTKWATITTTTLFVREKKSTDSAVLTMVPIDETFQVRKEYGDWVKIVVDEGDEADSATVGFVSKDYVDLSVTFEEAISIQEEKAEERRKAEAEAALEAAKAEQEKREQEKREQQQSLVSSSNTKSSSSSSNRSSSSSSSNSASSSNTSSASSSNNSRPSSSSNASSSSNTGSSSASGSAIAAFAQKFIGNPYVYGGTSLTNGTDCSGFSQSVFRNFGISIPRTSSSQSGSGKSVSVSSVQPGDLIFYASNGRINHVAIYIGGGQVVHASNERTGIRTSNMYYRQPSCARRYW